MTKNLFFSSLLFGILAAPVRMSAAPIDSETAKKNVLGCMSTSKKKAKGNPQLTLAYAKASPTHPQQPSLYAFNIGNGNGFVIASADDGTAPILGYCDQGYFDPNNVPANMMEWLERYAEQISMMEACPSTSPNSDVARNSNSNKHTIDEMLVTKWGQNAPFNDLCIFNEKRCLTGCVATAMAQILYFWASTGKDGATFRPGCTALDGYKSSFDVPALEAIETFDWDVMHPLRVESLYSVAQLMRYCGQSLHMRYGINNSEANGHYVATALKEHFGYNYSIGDIAEDSYTVKEWEDVIYNELSNGRPVLFHGGRHCFVCDGYDADTGFFHFNWGWNGGHDGWFAMTALNPSNYNFNSNLFALININPIAKNEPTSYANLSEDETTLTFYYDSNYENRDGKLFRLNGAYDVSPLWCSLWEYDEDNTIDNVVFDPSFASATPSSMNGWFNNMRNLTSITGIQNLNTERVADMSFMFSRCGLTVIDLSGFDFSKVRDMTELFSVCPNLQYVDFTNVDASNVTYMKSMFNDCQNLYSLDMSSMNISKVEEMQSMFFNCFNLREVDLGNTPNAKNMRSMFENCYYLANIRIKDMGKVENCDGMFNGCSNLKEMALPSNLSIIGEGMFYNCGLKIVSLPSSITSIGDKAFMGCNQLTHVVVRFDQPIDITSDTFSNRKNAILHVPVGTRQLFEAADYWKDFLQIHEWAGTPGDVNFDNMLNISDVTSTVDFILGSSPDTFFKAQADTNQDGDINVADVLSIVEMILGQKH